HHPKRDGAQVRRGPRIPREGSSRPWSTLDPGELRHAHPGGETSTQAALPQKPDMCTAAALTSRAGARIAGLAAGGAAAAVLVLWRASAIWPAATIIRFLSTALVAVAAEARSLVSAMARSFSALS